MSGECDEDEVVVTVRVPRRLKRELDAAIAGNYSTMSEFLRAKMREEVERVGGIEVKQQFLLSSNLK